jgi:outer membrane protein assembly factor BamB
VNRPAFLTLFAAAVLVAPAAADNWPQWRGAHFDGISTETGLPTTWGEGKNIAWTFALPGMGCSTPAVWNDRMFLTSEVDADGTLVLLCVGTDGKERWRKQVGASTKKARGDEGNGASASPATDGKHVWAFVASGELACYDLDGKEVWKTNLQERFGKFQIQFGMHSTPLLYEGKLYLMLLHSGGQTVAALDAATGKTAWKVARPSDGHSENEHSYASPCLWVRDGSALLIVHGNDYTTAHRLTDGSEAWRVGGLNPKERYNATLRFVASPVAVPDLVVIPTAKKGQVVAVRPDASGLVMPGSQYELWRRPNGTPDVPSPLVKDGLVYLCTEIGNLICLDAKTGKEHYNERTHNARHRGSPVWADGKVYLTARDGTVTVVQAGPAFKPLATNRLKDEIAASPAVSGGRIYLRGFKTLYAISEGGK